jgi:hypothetical protein
MTPLNRRPMQHIDRRDLYTSLEARIQYLHSFLDFSSRKSDKGSPIRASTNGRRRHRSPNNRRQIHQSAHPRRRQHRLQKAATVRHHRTSLRNQIDVVRRAGGP